MAKDPGTIDLADFEADLDLDTETYETRLTALQHQMELIQAAYINQGLKAVIALEGWDAAGKGGLITRLVGSLDHRYTHVWSIGAPTKPEADHHFLWRFWQRLPGRREIAVFDRTWYGRVLVERVDKLTPKADWQRAYDEINAFEALHIADGARFVKLFLHISQDEQDKRLKERIETPWKRWKTGPEDYHNRANRDAYLKAYHDMFERTSTPDAPWTVIAANDKKSARIKSIETVVAVLSKDIDLDYPPADPALVATAEAALNRTIDIGN
ncbi:polyphosphate kinase 2 family protein [Polymorphobacter fuscus]|uniref:Polyphosphate kinase n=1 Tax=Sandarakinorhabdus fusca TaxID=1439888 RepID=A0A7C9GNW5_9SPHN|nr:polyphosphate kinase [Polymorphobacter fuscus]KAB7648708.1 polyphosphate kinase [Polymorphobacter fuscus]MQT16270.1 polyphosphate kinase [Polymorphobacter fuscus]NJC07445.1 polyphosphate kinase 2 (PPK2 family) [Polymorphobacter fuscus]